MPLQPAVNKLISYRRAFKMLENDMYITGIGRFRALKSGQGITKGESSYFRNFRTYEVVSLKMTSHLTSDNFQR